MSDINKRIAEQIIGWKTGSEFNMLRPFKPSTDIADAWLVVEKMREDGYMVDVSTLDDLEFEDYMCAVWSLDGNDNTIVKDEKAPMAICLAALKVKEGEG